MRFAAAVVLFLTACKPDPGGGQLTGTSTPEAMGQRETAGLSQTQTVPAPNDTAVTGTFGGGTPGAAIGTSATTGTETGTAPPAPTTTRTTT